MKNNVSLHGDYALVELKRKDGTVLYTTVSACDLDLLHSLDVTLCPTWNPATRSYYVNFHIFNTAGRPSKKALHRLLMGDPVGKVVDHRNHDTLDNRRDNLLIVTNSENMQNRRGNQRNNKSGYRGVAFHPKTGKWTAQITINMRKKYLGLFNTPEEASEVATKARQMYYTNLNSEANNQ